MQAFVTLRRWIYSSCSWCRRSHRCIRRYPHGIKIAAPGGITMDCEIEAFLPELHAHLQDVTQRINRALLSTADHGDDSEHRSSGRKALLQRLGQLTNVETGLEVDGNCLKAVLTEPKEGHSLWPGVVSGRRNHCDR